MKVLVVSSGYHPDVKGGGEHSTKIISEELAASGHEVNVLTLSNKVVDEVINHVAIHRNLSPNLYWNFNKQKSRAKKIFWHLLDNFNPQAFRLVKSYIEKYNPDVVLTSTIENFGPEAWRASRMMKKPVVHVLRSYYVVCYRGTCFKNEQNCSVQCNSCKLMTIGRRYVAKEVDGLIGISHFILEKHKPVFPNAISRVIYNPIQSVDAQAKQLHGDSVSFGYLGRLEPEKGIELLLETFMQLPENCHLHVGGTGDEKYVAYLKGKYNKPNILFLGWINSKEVYEKIHYLILPAQWHEPFGRVVVEAFSYGIPVIGAIRGGIPELINEGENGYLFEPSEHVSLKIACLKALQNLEGYSTISSNALASSKQFDKSLIGKHYESMLMDVVSNYKT